MPGCQDEVRVNVRELECLCTAHRHFRMRQARLVTNHPVRSSTNCPVRSPTNQLSGSVVTPIFQFREYSLVGRSGKAVGLKRLSLGVVYVAVCDVVAVEDDVFDDVCVCVRRVPLTVGGGKTIVAGFGIAINTRCASYTIPSATA